MTSYNVIPTSTAIERNAAMTITNTLSPEERVTLQRATIEERWGTALYRTFQLYLWGSAEGFQRDMIQAYRLVLRAP